MPEVDFEGTTYSVDEDGFIDDFNNSSSPLKYDGKTTKGDRSQMELFPNPVDQQLTPLLAKSNPVSTDRPTRSMTTSQDMPVASETAPSQSTSSSSVAPSRPNSA